MINLETYVKNSSFFKANDVLECILNKVIPDIFENKEEQDTVRIWISGCATGETVYSLLILFEEYFEKIGKRHNIKVFATDEKESKLDYASKGIYDKGSMESVSSLRKQKFFNYIDNKYYVSSNLRKKIIFMKHDLINDDPFYNLDFVLFCDYLEDLNQINNVIIPMLHFAINDNGYMGFKNAKNISVINKHFKKIDNEVKIYKHISKMKSNNLIDINSKRNNKKIDIKNKDDVDTNELNVIDHSIEELKIINDNLKLINDELYIINHEYKTKIQELMKNCEELQSIVNLCEPSIIHLDKELCIKKFTSSTKNNMKIIRSDLGKSIYDVIRSFDSTEVIDNIQGVLIDLKEKEDIIKDKKGDIYKIKISPDVNKIGRVNGVVINILDISSIVNNSYLSSKLKIVIDKGHHINVEEMIIDIYYIINNQNRITELIMDTHYEKSPELKKLYTPSIHERVLDSILSTFYLLKLSIECKDNSLFIRYINWLKILLVSYNVPILAVKKNFEVILEVLKKEGILDEHIEELLNKVINIIGEPYKKEIYTCDYEKHNELCKNYLDCLLKVDRQGANKIIFDAYSNKVLTIQEIYLDVIYPVMTEVGHLWHRNIISVTQEHYCSSVTQSILERLSLEISTQESNKFVYLGACVSKELHEMGGKIVADLFKIGGWNSYYLGANTPISGLIKFIKDMKVDVLGLSASMLIHVEEVKTVIESIRKDEECKDIKIIVGGYIFNQSSNLWRYVGADGYGKDAQESYEIGCNLKELKVIDNNLELAKQT